MNEKKKKKNKKKKKKEIKFGNNKLFLLDIRRKE